MSQEPIRSARLPVAHAFLRPGQEPPDGALTPRCVHGSRVLLLAGPEGDATRAADITADGLVSATVTSALAVPVADCIPVLMSSRDGDVIGVVHCGLAGLVDGVLENAILQFRTLGIDTAELVCALGPSIRQCCYEVSAGAAQSFESRWGHLWSSATRPWSFGRHEGVSSRAPEPHGDDVWLSLQTSAILQLQAEGVPAGSIDDLAYCTYCSGTDLSSYRRRMHEGGEKKFQWAWVRLGKSEARTTDEEARIR